MSDNRWLRVLGEIARGVLKAFLSDGDRGATPGGSASGGPVPKPRPPANRPDGARDNDYPGDFTGTVSPQYAPNLDGTPDPGEVVWTWVPYEEDFSQGKDRPVLLIGRDGRWLLGLQLTSKDHDKDAAQEARAGRRWMDIGTGGWDRQARPSEVRLNRILRIDPDTVRREGDILDKTVFDQVSAAL